MISSSRETVDLGLPVDPIRMASHAVASHTPVHYWEIMVRRFGLVVVVFVGVAIGLFLAASSQRPVYQSTASLLVSDPNRAYGGVDLLGRSGPWSLQGASLANHIEVLRSHALANMVLASLPDTAVGHRLSATGPDAASALRRLVSVRPVRDADVVQLGIRAESPGLARELAQAYVDAYQEFTLARSRADVSAVKAFVRSQLDMVSARLDSAERRLEEFKRVSRVSDITQETKALVDRQTEALVLEQEASARRGGIEAELAFLDRELENMGEGLGVSSMVPSLRGELCALESERTSLLDQGFPETGPRVKALNERVETVRKRLSRELDNVVSKAGAGDAIDRVPVVLDRVHELRSELARVKAQESALGDVAQRYDRELGMVPNHERGLARLTRDVDVDRQVYALLAQRYEEARIQEAGRLSAVGVVDVPRLGTKIRPSLRNNLLLSLLVGLVTALGAAFAAERLDSKVRRPEDLERSGYSVLAGVPRISEVRVTNSRALRKKNDQASTTNEQRGFQPGHCDSDIGVSPELVTLLDPRTQEVRMSELHDTGAPHEAFRILRTNLQFATCSRMGRRPTASHAMASRPDSSMVVVVTSPGPSEGKTMVAANLAVVLAQSGKRTLVVDADLRRPRLHRLFGGHRKPGLTDVVMLGVPLERAVRPVPVEGLEFLSAGTAPPSPVDFLNSAAFERLLQGLAATHDYVVFDSPPVLVSADAAVLASKVDGVLLVARMGSTDMRALAEARKVLAQAGAEELGVAANDLRQGRWSVAGYGYSRYRYRYYQTRAATA